MNHLSNLSRGISAIAVTLMILGSYADAGDRYGSRYLGYQHSTHGSLGYQYAGGLNYPNVCGATGYCLSDTGSTYFHRPYGNNFFSNHLRWRGDVDADTGEWFRPYFARFRANYFDRESLRAYFSVTPYYASYRRSLPVRSIRHKAKGKPVMIENPYFDSSDHGGAELHEAQPKHTQTVYPTKLSSGDA